MADRCRHFFVSGKVQNVFFRDSTCKKAQALSLTGWVKNLDDGRVEVIACGAERQLDIFEEWLWQGPDTASVSEVTEESCDQDATFEEFSIK